MEKKLGQGMIFFDRNSIGVGTNFWTEITEALARVRVVLVLIGRTWTDTQDEHGRRRLAKRTDPVRKEVGIALKAQSGMTVVPVLVDDAKMPPKSRLPAELRDLRLKNATTLRTDHHFRRDVLRLCAFLQHALRRRRELKYADLYREPMVGRERELHGLTEWMVKDGLQLVSLVGGPGLGKTHMACALAESPAICDYFKERVFVNLSDQDTVEKMCHEVAEQLDVRSDGNDTRRLIQENLDRQEGALLVIMDNLEQFAEEADAIIREWARTAKNVTFLVTSRLKLGGRWMEMPVGPLTSVPIHDRPLNTHATEAGEELLCHEAVQLFQRHARAQMAAREMDSEANLGYTRKLCLRLDLNPLAIVLTAHLTLYRSVQALYQEISHTLEQADSSDHKLFRVVERSMDLVGADAREVFVKSQIFEDGFGREAAVSVLGAEQPDRTLRSSQITKALFELERHGLLTTTEYQVAGQVRIRYRMYRIVHEVAKRHWDLMRASKEVALLERAWTGYFRDYVITWNSKIHGPHGQEALEMLSLERENILAGIELGLETQDTGAAEMMLAYAEHLKICGPWDVRERLLARCLHGVLPATMRVDLLGHLVQHYWATAQYDQADELVGSIEEFRDCGECRAEYAKALLEVGSLRHHEEGPKASGPLFERCRQLFEAEGDHRGLSRVKREIASIFDVQGRQQDALDFLEPAIEYFDKQGDLVELARTINKRAIVRWHYGSLDEAILDFCEAERLYRSLNDDMWIAGTITNRGLALTDAGRFEEAIECFIAADFFHLKSSNRAWQAVNMVGHGQALYYAGSYDESMAMLKKAMLSSKHGKYRENIALCALNMGCVQMRKNSLKAAEATLGEVRETQKDLYPQGSRRVFRTLAALANVYHGLGRAVQAEETVREALAMAEKFGIDESDRSPVMRNEFMELLKVGAALKTTA